MSGLRGTVCLLLCVTLCTSHTEAAGEWKYSDNGPAHWVNSYEDCGKLRQSPINIESDKCEYMDELDDISLLDKSADDSKDVECFTLVNNGHTAKVGLKDMKEVYIVGGGLGELYRVAQFHFHWGSTNDKGSEHAINNHRFPLEMHIVSYDTERFSSLGDAVNGYNSLAVLGVMFEVTAEDNPALTKVIEALDSVQTPVDPVSLKNLDISALLPAGTDEYYRYGGSLTTPPCFQSVRWTVFKNSQTISQSQLDRLRSLSDGHEHAIVDNWRPLQELNGRTISCSFDSVDDDSVGYKADGKDDPDNAATSLIAITTIITLNVLTAIFVNL